jgi:hypothetical protein
MCGPFYACVLDVGWNWKLQRPGLLAPTLFRVGVRIRRFVLRRRFSRLFDMSDMEQAGVQDI